MTERSQVPPDSDDVADLLGAYVLDAVDEIERRRVERAAGRGAGARAGASKSL